MAAVRAAMEPRQRLADRPLPMLVAVVEAAAAGQLKHRAVLAVVVLVGMQRLPAQARMARPTQAVVAAAQDLAAFLPPL